uniref:Uncharacterized protein n=1 Tax=Glossina pallidipes TaxID=7398 RepID=A0A1A9ZLH3_GLOPL
MAVAKDLIELHYYIDICVPKVATKMLDSEQFVLGNMMEYLTAETSPSSSSFSSYVTRTENL